MDDQLNCFQNDVKIIDLVLCYILYFFSNIL